jgi:hypothetical protein
MYEREGKREREREGERGLSFIHTRITRIVLYVNATGISWIHFVWGGMWIVRKSYTYRLRDEAKYLPQANVTSNDTADSAEVSREINVQVLEIYRFLPKAIHGFKFFAFGLDVRTIFIESVRVKLSLTLELVLYAALLADCCTW